MQSQWCGVVVAALPTAPSLSHALLSRLLFRFRSFWRLFGPTWGRQFSTDPTLTTWPRSTAGDVDDEEDDEEDDVVPEDYADDDDEEGEGAEEDEEDDEDA